MTRSRCCPPPTRRYAGEASLARSRETDTRRCASPTTSWIARTNSWLRSPAYRDIVSRHLDPALPKIRFHLVRRPSVLDHQRRLGDVGLVRLAQDLLDHGPGLALNAHAIERAQVGLVQHQ